MVIWDFSIIYALVGPLDLLFFEGKKFIVDWC